MEPRMIRCQHCREFYEHIEGCVPQFCPKCTAELDEMKKNIRDLIRKNKGICVLEVEKLTGFPVSIIMETLNEGSVEILE